MKGFQVLKKASELLRAQEVGPITIHATKFHNFSKESDESLRRLGFVLYGRLADSDYEQVYRRIKAVVVPSVWEEPLPYVVAEALLRGRLVIASDIGGISEMVEDCKGVFLFDPGSAEQLAEKMSYVYRLSTDEAERLGMNNRKTISERFEKRKILRDFVDLCEDLV